MNRLRQVLERQEPTMAVTLTGKEDAATLELIQNTADVNELRADLHQIATVDSLTARIKKLVLPVILTVRSATEGGKWRGTEVRRLDLYGSLLPVVEGVDVELAAPILPHVIEQAREQDKVVIASAHNFGSTPETPQLRDMIDRAREAGANYFKLAAHINDDYDYNRLAEFTASNCDNPGIGLIVVGMGEEYGPQSRIEFPMLGSSLTYAHSGAGPVATGQMDFLQTHERLAEVSPSYAGLLSAS